MKRVAIIGSAGVPCRYGGFETLAEELVTRIGGRFRLSVYCSGKTYPREERHKEWQGARLFYMPLKANGWQSIPYDILCMLHALFRADTFLVLGVSGAVLFPFLKLFTRKKLIVHLDGIEWKREKWQGMAKRYLRLAEKLAVRYGDRIISDNEGIRAYVYRTYGEDSELIEYGGDQARRVPVDRERSDRYSFIGHPYAFKVCRIVPENNVELILEAFASQPQRQLVFVGDWDNSSFGRDLRSRFGRRANLHMLDPIYDPEELGLLRSNCFLYVHGHSAGGTNPSLVEAMYLGLPVAAFDVNFNRETTEGLALFFRTAEELSNILATARVAGILETGRQLQSVAHRRYTWGLIAEKYGRLLNGQPVEQAIEPQADDELTPLRKTGSD